MYSVYLVIFWDPVNLPLPDANALSLEADGLSNSLWESS